VDRGRQHAGRQVFEIEGVTCRCGVGHSTVDDRADTATPTALPIDLENMLVPVATPRCSKPTLD
jgi:hypothetical protein